MPFKYRQPEGQALDSGVLGVFSRVAAWTGRPAAWRVGHLMGDALGPGKRVLDIGTGPGTIPLNLARLHPGTQMVGLDISYEMLEKALVHRERMGIFMDFTAADGEFLPFRENSMDVVTSLFSLHHMDRPAMLLREADRVLKPGGQLLIIDFRRDMSKGLFSILNSLWQAFFLFSEGRKGFFDSVRSAWRPEEIEDILKENALSRFSVKWNPMELFIMSR